MNDSAFTFEVADLVPHRRGMSWLDRILSVDADGVVAEADIRPDSFFIHDGMLDIWMGIEYMAQAVAAWAGHRARCEERALALGFLVGTRRYDAFRQGLRVGECLRIEAQRELMTDSGLGMFTCRILVDGVVAASANISVFEPPDGAHFLDQTKGNA